MDISCEFLRLIFRMLIFEPFRSSVFAKVLASISWTVIFAKFPFWKALSLADGAFRALLFGGYSRELLEDLMDGNRRCLPLVYMVAVSFQCFSMLPAVRRFSIKATKCILAPLYILLTASKVLALRLLTRLSTLALEDELLSTLHTSASDRGSTSISSVSPLGPTRPGLSMAFFLCFRTIFTLAFHYNIAIKELQSLTATSGKS